MAKVLSISSQVVHGHVGNSCTAFVMQRMGHEVLGLPTILLSNRPGYEAIAGERIDAAKLDAMLEAVASNGWLADVDAIFTGYLPTREHAGLSQKWIARIKSLNPGAIYLCDPIIGDEPGGMYIDESAALAVRDGLVPLADILTPNAFELSWLSDRATGNAAEAIAAANLLSCPAVLVTSAPANMPNSLANILVEASGAAATVSPRQTVQAHGTGDFFASHFLSAKLNGLDNRTALRAATAAINIVLGASVGRGELAIVETQAAWAKSDPALAPLASIAGADTAT